MQDKQMNCAPSTNCKSEINNTEIDNGRDSDIVMPLYNLAIIQKHLGVCGNITEMSQMII